MPKLQVEVLEKAQTQKEVNEEYLTIGEVAALCKVTTDTIKDRMRRGLYRLGVHFFRPNGARPRFKRSAVIAWLEGSGDDIVGSAEELPRIPMARGYMLGRGAHGNQGKAQQEKREARV